MKESIISHIYHAPPSFLLKGKAVTLSALIPVTREGELLPTMTVSLEGKRSQSLCMKECDRLIFDEGMFVSFSVSVPAERIAEDGSFVYQLRADGKTVGEYTVPVIALPSLSELPPIVITELHARPNSAAGNVFVEVMNPSDKAVDLYDYKMVLCPGEVLCNVDTAREMGLSDTPGSILPPGGVAVLRILPLALRNSGDPVGCSAEGLVKAIAAYYPYPFDLDPSTLTVFNMDNAVYDEAAGKYVVRPGSFNIPMNPPVTPYTLAIGKREEYDPENAIFSLTFGLENFRHDIANRRSSIWGLDLRHPKRGVRLDTHCLPTPGSLAPAQAFPNLEDAEAPVIVPLTVLPYYLRSGDMSMRFALLDETVTSATLYVKDENGKYQAFAATNEGREDVYEAQVPFSFLSRLERFEYYITASDSIRSSSLGSADAPLTRTLYDNVGPQILSVEPALGYAEDRTRTPRIRITYYDRAGVNVLKGKLKLDGKDVSKKAKWYSDAVVYLPEKELSYGAHTISLTVYDLLGNKTQRVSEFSVVSGDKLECYHGEVHCHTIDSDGSGFPEQAMAYARDEGKVDFFAVTEHSHYAMLDTYRRQREIADLYDAPGKFAALYGWEMTWNGGNGLWGHMNVLGTEEIVRDIDNVTLPQVYEFLEKHPEAVAMFNHPCLAWGNFDEYGFYTPEADKRVCLSEIKGMGYDQEYAVMLAKGWHAAPVFNEDNHAPNWTTAVPSTGYVLAPALTRENIMEAFRRRRTYSTGDPTMKLKYRVNGAWLGSTLKNPSSLSFHVDVKTENPNGLGKIQLIGEDNIVVAEEDVGALTEFTWDLTLSPLYDYYYVRILADKCYTVTAPVWVERSEAMKIRHVRVFHNGSPSVPNAVSVRVDNHAAFALKNIRVDFYLTDPSGFVLSTTKPYETVYLDKIKGNDTVCVTRRFPNVSRRRRVTAIVTAEDGDRILQETAYVLLSPLDITSVVPSTSLHTKEDGTVVANPFSYVQLFNTSSSELDLSDAQLRLWSHTGKAPTEDAILSLKGVKIPARSPFVVWRRPKGSELTVDDFNARYGTHLVEGENLLVTELHVTSSSGAVRRIDVVVPGGVLARVNYNMGLRINQDVVEDNALCYRYKPNLTGTADLLEGSFEPSPAIVSDEQKARDFIYFDKKEEEKGAKNAEKRRVKAEKKANAPKVSKTSAAAMAVGAAAGAATVTAVLMRLVGKKGK